MQAYHHPIQFFGNTVPLKSRGIVESRNFFLRILYFFCAQGEYAESIQITMENARKVSKHTRRLRGKFLCVYGENGKLGFFAVHKIISKYAESI